MTFAALKPEVDKLNPAGQKELLAYLLELRYRQNPDFRGELSRRLADKSSRNWHSLADVKRRSRERE